MRLFLASLVLSFISLAPVIAAKNLSLNVTSGDLLSGAADSRMQEFAVLAKDKKLVLVVTAPDYWHEKIGEKLAVNDKRLVVYKNTLVESVIIRAKDPKSVVVVAPVKRSQPTAEPDDIIASIKPERPNLSIETGQRSGIDRRTRVPVDLSQDLAAELGNTQLELAPVSNIRVVETSKPKSVAPLKKQTKRISQAVVAVPDSNVTTTRVSTLREETPQLIENASQRVEVEPEQSSQPTLLNADFRLIDEALDKRIRKRLNANRKIRSEYLLTQINQGDQIFVYDKLAVGLRISPMRSFAYWIVEPLDLTSNALEKVNDRKYKVIAKITDATSNTRPDAKSGKTTAVKVIPEQKNQIARRFNRGKDIEESLSLEQLRKGDVIYKSGDYKVVVRRGRLRVTVFWLEGGIDFENAALKKKSENKYVVLKRFRRS